MTAADDLALLIGAETTVTLTFLLLKHIAKERAADRNERKQAAKEKAS